MPNSIGSNGLILASYAEMRSSLVVQMQTIYGSDINLDPSSPDGQMLNIFLQSVVDLQDLIQQVNAMFDPDEAVGSILDQRVAINGIQRQGGTFTLTNVTITTNQSVNLYGLDQNIQPVYTVQDNAGNQWDLITSVIPPSAGSYVLAFQSATPGAVLSVPNTIQTQTTIVLGVTAVNNPTTYSVLGLNEESDVALKIRRQQSVALSSQGYLSGLLAALLNISGVTSAYVYENTSGTTDANGVPGHSIWVIIANNNAAPAAIANAIYTKRNAGCGMKGSQSYLVSQPDGSQFNILWDFVTPEALFIEFTASSIDGITVPNYQAILEYLTKNYSPSVAQVVNTNQLIQNVNSADPNTLVSNAGFSTTSTGVFVQALSTSGKNYQFGVTSPNIIILPILLTPTSNQVVHGSSSSYSSIGGYGTYTYSLKTNNSGGSINASTGVYTAGSSSSVIDVIKVVDTISNTQSVSVSVT